MPCEKFSRKTSTPASTICLITAGSLDAGPTVATILVRTFPSCFFVEFIEFPIRIVAPSDIYPRSGGAHGPTAT